MSLKKKIIEKELALTAFEARHSIQQLRSLISTQFMEIGASGDYFGFNEVLKQLPQNNSWSCHFQDIQFKEVTLEVVHLVYLAFIKHTDNGEGTFSRRSSIWRKEGNDWKMWFHQGTKISPFKLNLNP